MEAPRAGKSFVEQFSVVQSLLASFEDDQTAGEKITRILEEYQEQPELLDPHLEDILSPLMETVRNKICEPENGEINDSSHIIHRSFKLAYILCKVRGYKTVVKFFPHEVKDLEPTLACLIQFSDRGDIWETQYSLLLWLSIIVLIPFDLSTVDSQLEQMNQLDDSEQIQSGGIVSRLIKTGTLFLSSASATRNASSVMLARLFSRPDVEGVYLSNFFQKASEILATSTDIFLTTGLTNCLAQIFKAAPRDVLLDKIPLIYDSVVEVGKKTKSPLHRKLLVKLSQRIGLTYLKPRLASWRYQRGNRSLLPELAPTSSSELSLTSSKSDEKAQDDKDDQIHVPKHIEDIIDQLLNGLRDKDTIVRWSAAKGVGRITMRLPSQFGDEVVGSVLELLSPLENANAWHGGCLCLAELARRGLLLPSRLSEVVPVVVKALVYDIQEGAHSIGAHVRDAACYVCWAFARAYSPEVMEKYVHDVASTLLVVAVFDREINCRRAACAAFQESVGRQGNFPRGIEINTTADYFTVGNRVSAYTQISVEIAKFSEYRKPLIDHLVNVKLFHWDKTIRELSSKALHNLTAIGSDYIVESVLPMLISQTLSKKLEERHGSVWGISAIITKLSEIQQLLSAELQKKIRNIVMKVEKARLYRGKGGQFMRGACCKLISSIAVSKMPISQKAILRLQDSIDENLKHPNEEIQEGAVMAMRNFGRQYYIESSDALQKRVVLKFIDKVLHEDNVACTRGYSLALGVLPTSMLLPNLPTVVECLIQATKIQDTSAERDAETRRNAVIALIELCETVGVAEFSNIIVTPTAPTAPTAPVASEASEPSVAASASGASSATSAASPVSPLDTGSELKRQEHQIDSTNQESDTPSEIDIITQIGSTLILCSNDYCCDNRGDVGSWVREASLIGLEKFIIFLAKAGDRCAGGEPWLTEDFLLDATCVIIKQIMEKIDRTRKIAGNVFERLLRCENPCINFPHRNELDEIFVRTSDIDWSAPSETFPLMINILQISSYRRSVFSGLCFSVGDLTQSLAKAASNSLLQYMTALNQQLDENQESASSELKKILSQQEDHLKECFTSKEFAQCSSLQSQINHTRSKLQNLTLQHNTKSRAKTQIDNLAGDILFILKSHQNDSRVIIPVFKTIGTLLTSSCFDSLSPEKSSFTMDLHACTKSEISRSRDILKFYASIDVYLGLIPFENPTRRLALRSLLGLLGCRYPRVRRQAADGLYSQLVTYEECVSEENLDEILDVIGETQWTEPFQEIQSQRERLYDLMGIEKPKQRIVKRKKADTKTEEQTSYKDMIKDSEMGY